MVEINLLRPVIEEKKGKGKTKSRYALYITIIVLILVVISGALFGVKYAFQNQASSNDKKISSLEEQVKEVDEIEEKINKFNESIEKIEKVKEKSLIWSKIYEIIAKDTPANIRLTKVALQEVNKRKTTADPSASSTKLEIDGETKTRRDVALFQDKLQKSGGDFIKVDIISSKKTIESDASGSEREVIDFKIDISLKKK